MCSILTPRSPLTEGSRAGRWKIGPQGGDINNVLGPLRFWIQWDIIRYRSVTLEGITVVLMGPRCSSGVKLLQRANLIYSCSFGSHPHMSLCYMNFCHDAFLPDCHAAKGPSAEPDIGNVTWNWELSKLIFFWFYLPLSTWEDGLNFLWHQCWRHGYTVVEDEHPLGINPKMILLGLEGFS